MFRSIVQKMKNAGKFLSFPILQYIPISIHTLSESENWPNPFNQPSPQLLLFQDPHALKSALERFQIQATIPQREELYVLCLNFRAELVLFRYLTCKIIGESNVGSYHVFTVTKKYFPRRPLHFALFEHDGRKLKSLNQEIY
ncbi:MAG: hypothetical protein SCK29_05990 [Bacillota bacterium]|nr:hypothetical protein [Bacillota bacterium]MDW7683657.1 hypothetical protein [Bacillota bacterium]